MRRILLWLLAVCVMLLWWLVFVPRCYPAVTIEAPEGRVPVDRFVIVPIAGAEETPQVKLWPAGATALVDISAGQPYVVFRADQPGQYEVTVIASRARVIPDDAYARCVIVAGAPEPEPKPEPKPEPPPPPPPPPASILLVQIVWEMRDADPLPIDQVLLFNSPAIEKWIDDNGHDLERVDVDAVDVDGKRVVSPEPESLPVVRVYDDDTGRLLWEGLPKTEAEFLETIQRHAKPATQPVLKRPRAAVDASAAAVPGRIDCPTCKVAGTTTPRSLDRPTGPARKPAARRGGFFRGRR